MAKAKKSPARKAAPRTIARPPAPIPTSLPPQIIEEAAQGWLKSSGAVPAVPPPAKSRELKPDALVECLDSTLQHLRAEISELRQRVARLEGRGA